MMKTSFTYFLKFKWRHVIPLLMMAVMAMPSAWAECDPDGAKITATIKCDGSLTFYIPDVTPWQVEINGFDVENPANETGFTILTPVDGGWQLPHATGYLEPGTPFYLKVTCDKDDVTTGFDILEGILPAWSLVDGFGAGDYKFIPTASLELGNPMGPTNVPNCGTLKLEIVETTPPWCSFTDDGSVVVRIVGNVDPKCVGSNYSITVDGVTKPAVIGQNVKFDNLAVDNYVAMLGASMLDCAGPVVIDPTEPFQILERQGATTSMACADRVNVSLSQSCKLTISAYDILLGVNDPCDPNAMADSITVSQGGTVLAGSGSQMASMSRAEIVAFLAQPGYTMADLAPRVEFEHGDLYVGQELKVSIYNRASGNSCWGYIKIEDKSAPIVTCDDDTSMEILCLEYKGNIANTLIEEAFDCSELQDPVIIAQDLIEDCDDIDDNVLRRITATYTISDIHGNKSNICTDTIDVLRFDQVPGNNTIELPGELLYACDFVLDPNPYDPLDKDPFACTGDFDFITTPEGYRIPAPTAVKADGTGGSGFPRLRWKDSKGIYRISNFLPANYPDADQAYQKAAELLNRNCNIVVKYEDIVLPFGCKLKIIRNWKLFEWSCDGALERDLGSQEIVVTDHVAPTFVTTVPDQQFSVNAFDCARLLEIDLPTIIDDCDTDLDPVEVAIYDQDWMLIGPLVNTVTNEPSTSFNFPLGWSYVVYRAHDACDNFRLDTAAVHIIDETPPVVICKEFLVVGLSTDGTVRVPAEAFDNGSYDDCGLERRCVLRMDDLELLQSLDTDKDGKVLFNQFNKLMIACGRDYSKYAFQIDGKGPFYIDEHTLCTPYVAFCCADNDPQDNGDEAEDIMINFRAYDVNGNLNTCMVFVDLQDKQAPQITCLADLTIDCNFDLPEYASSYDNIADDPLSQYFGTITTQNNQKAFGIPTKYIIYPEDRSGLGDGVYFDNCRAPRIEVKIEDNIDNCGFGYIIRTIQAVDGDNRSNVCIQKITIRRTVFDDASIIFPNDTTLIGCAIPEELVNESFGEPRVVGDDCSLIGISEENQIFTFNTQEQDADACFKILRTWTVIDWCQSTNGGQPFVLGRDIQIIKVNDPDGPDLTCSPDVNVETTDCFEENVMLMATADDECTRGDDLLWSARLEMDQNNDGEVETFIDLDDIDITQDDNGKATYTLTAPVGSHRIIWTVQDRCGNIESCQQNFTVTSTKKPTPFAINVSTALMNTNGTVEIWAADFDPTNKSFHACYPDAELSYAISHQGAGFDAATPNLTFTCSDSIINFLDFYVFLEVNGQVLFEYTTVSLRVDDNNVCTNTRGGTSGTEVNAFITGNIRTEDAMNVPNVVVDLMGGNQGASALEAVKTDQSGMYAFPAMASGGKYIINPQSGDDYLNGVSTLDLVMIQRYVLGLLDLDSPYKLIAADINNDTDVSALDLVELRKAILGYTTEFKNNTSWKFVDAAYGFLDETSPWDERYNENFDISTLEGSMEIDFIGVKVGDVNGSVDAASVVAKSRSIHMLNATEASFQSGQEVVVNISTVGAIDVVGTQLSIEFDANRLDFVGIEATGLSIGAEHIGMSQIAEGIVNLSWNDIQSKSLKAGQEMFTLLFTARSSGNVSTSVDITSAGTQAEIYNDELEVLGLGLSYNSQVDSGFKLYQNTPNPFTEETTIEFSLPSASNATLSVHDVTGKLIHSTTGSFDKGNNYITVSTSELTSSGVMYYTISSDKFTDTKRMVVLK